MEIRKVIIEEVLTEELLKELLSRPEVDSFIDGNDLEEVQFCECLNDYMNQKGMDRKSVIHKTNINETHAYQMFSGDRGASRNKVLQMAIAMGLNLKETNRLLHSAGVSALYCKNRRDAIIIFCIEKGENLQSIDEKLFEFNEATISDV